jgi:hypothetical protein
MILAAACECHWYDLDEAISLVVVTLLAKGQEKDVLTFQVSRSDLTDKRKDKIEEAAITLVNLAVNAQVPS